MPCPRARAGVQELFMQTGLYSVLKGMGVYATFPGAARVTDVGSTAATRTQKVCGAPSPFHLTAAPQQCDGR